MAALIEKELGQTVRLERGRPGQFQVMVDGQTVIGKQPTSFLRRLLGDSGLPEENQVIELLRTQLREQATGS